jgi:general L-amino acid transport system substrate-binding protein
MFKHTKKLFAVLAAFSLLFVYACEPGGGKQSKGKSKTLKQTQSKGFVRCGVSQGLPGFSNADASGNWTGVDVDVCRAVAAAVLGDASKVKYTPLSAKERFTALTSGEIDILSRNTTWTLSRDADIGLTFVGVNLTLFASPSTAAATALHTSTSTPVQFPAASALENPGRP